jgi:lipopolysaccharide biosynthesis regulator YciM
VIHSLCRIYEDIEDWDQAYNYRIMLSKVGHQNQADTISHILVEKAKAYFDKGEFKKCEEDLDDAFRFAPSVSAKILHLKLFLLKSNLEQAKFLLLEILKEHPMYASFIFLSLTENFNADKESKDGYFARLEILRNFFLEIEDLELNSSPSVVLSKVRLLKSTGMNESAHEILKVWMGQNKASSEVMKVEYVKLLIDLEKKDEAIVQVKGLLENIHQTLTKHYCSQCGFNSDNLFWRCPQCHEWETIQFRWKV